MLMDRKLLRVCAFVLSVWAIVYLPGLGSAEIKGEEGRRIFPAQEMLRGGSWVVPSIGGEKYYNKPPGINWLVAASFALTGRQDEWSARLPSVLAVLALALAIALVPGVLSARARLLAAVLFLASVGTLEKGRLIEIEAIYMCLTGLALVWWLNRYPAHPRGIVTWIVPSLLMAFAALVKGPFMIPGFYPIVIAVTAFRGRLRDLFCPAHLLGIAMILVLCLGWVGLVMVDAGSQTHPGNIWVGQAGTRFAWVSFSEWGREAGKALLLLLPSLLLLPLAWMRRFAARPQTDNVAAFRGLRLGTALGLAMLLAIPGLESRYVMPVLPAVVLLGAWVLEAYAGGLASDRIWKAGLIVAAFGLAVAAGFGVALAGGGLWPVTACILAGLALLTAMRMRHEAWDGFGLGTATAMVLVLGTVEFIAFGPALQTSGDQRRQMGESINRLVPQGETLHVYKPGCQMFMFYLRSHVDYVLSLQDLGTQGRYVLVSDKEAHSPEVVIAMKAAGLRPVRSFWCRSDGRWDLLERQAKPQAQSASAPGSLPSLP